MHQMTSAGVGRSQAKPTILRNPRVLGLRCINCERDHPIQDLPLGCPVCASQGTPSSLEVVYSARPTSLCGASSGYRWGAWLPYTQGISRLCRNSGAEAAKGR